MWKRPVCSIYTYTFSGKEIRKSTGENRKNRIISALKLAILDYQRGSCVGGRLTRFASDKVCFTCLPWLHGGNLKQRL